MDEDLLPARMVNEFVYCPRLFYLEWVQGRFADNDDTRLGQEVHRRVDTQKAAAPLPEEGELRIARSVTLSSHRHRSRHQVSSQLMGHRFVES